MKKKIDTLLFFGSSQKLEKPFMFVVYEFENKKNEKEHGYKFRFLSRQEFHEADILDLEFDNDGINSFDKGSSYKDIFFLIESMFINFGFKHDTICSPLVAAGFEGGGEIIYKEFLLNKKTQKIFRRGGGLILDQDDNEQWSSGHREVKPKDIFNPGLYGFSSYYLNHGFLKQDFKHVYEFPLKQHLMAHKLWEDFRKKR